MPVVPSGARHSTLNINSIHGGLEESRGGGLPSACVADSCRMVIDRRLFIEEDLDDVKAEIRGLLDELARERAGFSYSLRDLFDVNPPWPIATGRWRAAPPRRCGEFSAARRNSSARRGLTIRSTSTVSAGCKDCIAYGPGILDLAHQPDEYVLIDDLVSSAKVMAISARSLLCGSA